VGFSRSTSGIVAPHSILLCYGGWQKMLVYRPINAVNHEYVLLLKTGTNPYS